MIPRADQTQVLDHHLLHARRVRRVLRLWDDVRGREIVEEAVGSLCPRSARFIVFDRYANIVAQHQIEFPQYYPEPG